MRLSRRGADLCAVLALLTWLVWRWQYVIACGGDCLLDFRAINGLLAQLGLADTRLNAWILSWVHHSWLTDAPLFDTNILYPARDTLAGSEHLIGVALLTFPFRLMTDNAVSVHQFALLLSSAICSLGTFALARRVSGSAWAAFVAGWIATMMPWRMSEISHIQILSAQWLPWIWLFVGRSLSEGARSRDLAALAFVLSLQLISSYYITYMATVSVAVVGAVVWLSARPDLRTTLRVVGTGLVSYGILFAVSIPYVVRRLDGTLKATVTFPAYPLDETFSRVFSVLSPPLYWRGDWKFPVGLEMSIPIVVLGLGIAGFFFRRGGTPEQRDPIDARAMVRALLAISVISFVLMPGNYATVGDRTISLPGQWLTYLLPGYDNVRAPYRWALAIGLAAPILAGIGAQRLESAAATRTGASATRVITRIGVLLAVFATLPSAPLPVAPVWGDAATATGKIKVLESLPPGPVLHLPWPLHQLWRVEIDTRYQLASTRHWKPMLNGFTAYQPRSMHLLQRTSAELPDPRSVEKLRRLAGVRWIAIHKNYSTDDQVSPWYDASSAGEVTIFHDDDNLLIIDLGRYQGTALLADAPNGSISETIMGLPRSAISFDPHASAGTLTVERETSFQFAGSYGVPSPVHVELTNLTDATWPGLDPRPDGLVHLRTVFIEQGEGIIDDRIWPIDADVHPGESVRSAVVIKPPARSGRLGLCYSLVQLVDDEIRPLAVPPVAAEVAVTSRRAKRAESAVAARAEAKPVADPCALLTATDP